MLMKRTCIVWLCQNTTVSSFPSSSPWDDRRRNKHHHHHRQSSSSCDWEKWEEENHPCYTSRSAEQERPSVSPPNDTMRAMQPHGNHRGFPCGLDPCDESRERSKSEFDQIGGLWRIEANLGSCEQGLELRLDALPTRSARRCSTARTDEGKETQRVGCGRRVGKGQSVSRTRRGGSGDGGEPQLEKTRNLS